MKKQHRQSGHAGRPRRAGSESAAVITAPVQKNEEVTLDIIGLTHEGEGVGRVEGYTLFVHGALPGERVRAHVLKVKKQYGYAKVIERLENSPYRMEPDCPVYQQCGGCQLQHLTYAEQLQWKQQHVVDVLERIGKFDTVKIVADGAADEQESVQRASESSKGESDSAAGHGHRIKVLPTIGMDVPWRYRNKAQVPIGAAADREGGLIGGFYARGSHRIIDMDACLIQHEANDEAVQEVKDIARKYGIAPYEEETHTGVLRHVVVRVGFRTNEMMVVLVTNGASLTAKGARDAEIMNTVIAEIVERLPQVKSICQNINMKRTNVIFGDETRVLWGFETITDYIGDVKFAISARSFYQVNPEQTEVLYAKALEYADLTGSETVIDAYCGIGTISLFLAQRAKRVLGVEIVEDAIHDARRNAELSGITNAEFAVGASEVVIPQWKSAGITADVIVVDPPRKGCDQALLDTMLEMRPERIVYVSCGPSTLARDLRILADGGYTVEKVQPVDMFPHTMHVETVCLLSKLNVDNK